MSQIKPMNFSVEKENKKILVERTFAAPIAQVWAAWTDSALLDQWWAPKPWRADTKSMDFREGGTWLYAMIGPDGTTHWSRSDFKSISLHRGYTSNDAFCDAEGVVNDDYPGSQWEVSFSESGDATIVHITISFERFEDLEATIKMGFKEGFTSGMDNLDELLLEKSVG